jgi:hypothetical protein
MKKPSVLKIVCWQGVWVVEIKTIGPWVGAAFVDEVEEEVLIFWGKGFYGFDRGLEGAGLVHGG